MPKKQQKSKEEKLAESFFPVDKDDLKYAIEKPAKTVDVSSLIKIEKGPSKKTATKRKTATKKTRKKTTRAKKSLKEFTPPKIKLKDSGYELIITEKPQAALKISSALGKSIKRGSGGVPFYEVDRNGKKLVVACTVGHLFTLTQKTRGSKVPVFDISWVPNSFTRKSDFTKKYLDTLTRLAKSAGSITVATDYDVEGEVIGLNAVRFIAGQADAARMKFSTLTEKELNKSYDEKLPSINWGQAISGETRHYLDWFYGINFSRALMNAIKTTGKFRIMSIGRVQGPTLKLIVEKEKQISEFKSQRYWQVFITVESVPTLGRAGGALHGVSNSENIELQHNRDIFEKSELEKFKDLKGKTGIASTTKREQKMAPNPPFNLTTLQTEAYRFHGITPQRTMRAAQSLYLAGLISYPRTSSQKLPPSISYKEIVETLSKKYKVQKLITRSVPIEGKKSDPAHPSIHPTGQDSGILSGDEEKIYELIVKRFLALFMDNAIVENKTIKVDVDIENNKTAFIKKGSEIKKSSWLSVYPNRIKELDLPDLDGEVKILDSRNEEKETQPPKRYSPASIISELEKRNLGTKATRTNIIETLYDRDYIKDQSIKATPLGISLIETLEKYCPIIIDETLTRNFEREMESIQQAKKDHVKKEEKIVEDAKKTITEIANQFIKSEKKIGEELIKANVQFREEQKEENKLNICPVCKKGNLSIMYSPKTRRYFVACNKYPDCRNTYSLPPNGLIKSVKPQKVCNDCGFPMVMRISKGRRPWEFCFNPNCSKNKERLEEYRKKKAAEENSEIKSE
ncbi:MAG: DNA topoisomerase I [Nanoarchaeota archaeon]|nr:DNA topoisomerase I [Nanoarchaeota archaeon]